MVGNLCTVSVQGNEWLFSRVCQAACYKLRHDGVVFFWEPCYPHWQEDTQLICTNSFIFMAQTAQRLHMASLKCWFGPTSLHTQQPDLNTGDTLFVAF